MFIGENITICKALDDSTHLALGEWREKTWHTQGSLFGCQGEWSHAIWRKWMKIQINHLHWSKPDTERQVSHVFSHIWEEENRHQQIEEELKKGCEGREVW